MFVLSHTCLSSVTHVCLQSQVSVLSHTCLSSATHCLSSVTHCLASVTHCLSSVTHCPQPHIVCPQSHIVLSNTLSSVTDVCPQSHVFNSHTHLPLVTHCVSSLGFGPVPHGEHRQDWWLPVVPLQGVAQRRDRHRQVLRDEHPCPHRWWRLCELTHTVLLVDLFPTRKSE